MRNRLQAKQLWRCWINKFCSTKEATNGKSMGTNQPIPDPVIEPAAVEASKNPA
jgi:hypothetical protein